MEDLEPEELFEEGKDNGSLLRAAHEQKDAETPHDDIGRPDRENRRIYLGLKDKLNDRYRRLQ